MSHEEDANDPQWTLIRTKLMPPELPLGAVVRPRLLERIAEGSDCRVTLISAPAGYGKTTLTRQWLCRADAPPFAWLSLDRLDADPERFCTHVVGALREVSPGSLSRTRAALAARVLPGPERLADLTVADLEELKQRVVLVLDDFHSVGGEAVHVLVRELIERLPRTTHLVVLTRHDPPWPISLWQTRFWLQEIRSRDLSFSRQEAGELVEAEAGLHLSQAAIDIMHRTTEGWAAGLRLAMLSLAKSAEPEEQVLRLSSSERLIVDYLMDEVVAAQGAEVRRMLAVTAPLSRFCGSLCDHLLADERPSEGSQSTLERLCRANMFIVPMGHDRTWYRYHHLFRELLLHNLDRLSPTVSHAAISRRAGDWFVREGWPEEGIRLLVAAGDLDGAADVVADHLYEVIERDLSRRTLARWLDLFPAGAEHGRLPLIVARLYLAILRMHTEDMARLIDIAERTCGDLEDGRAESWWRRFRPDLEGLQACVRFWAGDPEEALAHATSALSPGKDRRGFHLAEGILYGALGLAFTGRDREYDAFIQNGLFQAETTGGHHLGLYLLAKASVELYRGELGRCRETALRILQAREETAIDQFFEGFAHLVLGLVAYERDLQDEAETEFREAEKLRFEVARILYLEALLGLAQVGWARGDLRMAEEHAARAREGAFECGDPPTFRSSVWFLQRLALAAGHEVALPAEPPAAPDFMLLSSSVPSETWAWLQLQNQSAERCRAALEVVERASSRAEKHGFGRRVIRLAVLRALTLDALGDSESALSAFEDAVRRAAPEQAIRPFVDCGESALRLLDTLSKRSDHPFLKVLMAAFAATPDARAAVADVVSGTTATTATEPPGAPWQVLTNRELDVLELLEKRLTNKEIAAELGIARETVKFHTLSIYRKLDVHDRRHAAVAALERGLIRRSRS